MVHLAHRYRTVACLLCMCPTALQAEHHRGNINNATSTWKLFDEGLTKAKKQWEANQNPPDFYNSLVKKVIEKFHPGADPNLETQAKVSSPIPDKATDRAMLVTQYRGTISDKMTKQLRSLKPNNSVIFTTRKLRTCLPSLKGPVENDLRSHVVYQIKCSGCLACYVGQTSRHFRTRLQERLKPIAPVGEYLSTCSGTAEYTTKVLNGSQDLTRLLTIEALYIREGT